MTEVLVNIKPIILIIHALAGGIGIGATVITDALFFQFLRDFKISKIESQTFKTISLVLWAALITLIITGALLYGSDVATYSASSKFLIKMTTVIVITLNGIVLNLFLTPRMKQLSFHTPHAHRRHILTKRVGFAAGSVSIISWFSAFLLGSVSSIPLTYIQSLGIYTLLIIAGISASQLAYQLLANTAKKSHKQTSNTQTN
jgi:hypothetical protein